jgi:hypothetical protein
MRKIHSVTRDSNVWVGDGLQPRMDMGVSCGGVKGMAATKPAKSPKVEYSEAEAAEELGVSRETLRSLIQRHIVEGDEDLTHVAETTFHASDLLLLRMLCTGTAASRKGPQSES